MRPAEVGVPRPARRYYTHHDGMLHNGFVYFYAVTATDPDHPETLGRLIYAYPNPATREALAEFQAMSPNAGDPTGVRISFVNLPACRSVINVFTLAGDLAQTIDHDGTDVDGQAYWNLTTRNGQEVVSGIYLFVVQPEDHSFEDTIGKVVVVR